jgi:hypothetical protein
MRNPQGKDVEDLKVPQTKSGVSCWIQINYYRKNQKRRRRRKIK